MSKPTITNKKPTNGKTTAAELSRELSKKEMLKKIEENDKKDMEAFNKVVEEAIAKYNCELFGMPFVTQEGRLSARVIVRKKQPQ